MKYFTSTQLEENLGSSLSQANQKANLILQAELAEAKQRILILEGIISDAYSQANTANSTTSSQENKPSEKTAETMDTGATALTQTYPQVHRKP